MYKRQDSSQQGKQSTEPRNKPESRRNSIESNISDKRLASKKYKDPEQLSSKKQESWLKLYQVICTAVSQWRCMNGLRGYEKVFNISIYQTMQIKAARESSASHHVMNTMEGRNMILYMVLQKSGKKKTRHCRHLMAVGTVWATNATYALFLKKLKSQSERWASTPLFAIAFFTGVKVQTCVAKHYSGRGKK